MNSPTSIGQSTQQDKRSADSRAAEYLRQRGVSGIIELACSGYRRYQSVKGNRSAPTRIVDGSETAVWSSLLEAEFRATGEEPDVAVGVAGILPVRALMAARMADQDFEPLAQAKQLLQGTPLQQQVLDSLTQRWAMESVVGLTTTPEAAIVVFTASALALDNPDHPYLGKLAKALRLPATLVKCIHEQSVESLSCQRI